MHFMATKYSEPRLADVDGLATGIAAHAALNQPQRLRKARRIANVAYPSWYIIFIRLTADDGGTDRDSC